MKEAAPFYVPERSREMFLILRNLMENAPVVAYGVLETFPGEKYNITK